MTKTLEIKKNAEKNGIELYFTDKPTEEVRAELKKYGFKWHNTKKCWYAKEDEKTLLVAETLQKAYDQEQPTQEAPKKQTPKKKEEAPKKSAAKKDEQKPTRAKNSPSEPRKAPADTKDTWMGNGSVFLDKNGKLYISLNGQKYRLGEAC